MTCLPVLLFIQIEWMGGGMKKRTAEEYARSRRLALRRWNRALLRRGKVMVRSIEVRVAPPSVLSFAKNFAETTDFLDRLRSETLSDANARKRVYVDLVPVRKLSVPVAIVLAAEFHRWSLIKKMRLRPRNSSMWSPEVRGLLDDLGVFELLQTRSVKASGDWIDNLTLTPLESGESFDGEKVNELQNHFAQSLAGFTSRPDMFEGLMEAAENAISHAYPKDYSPPYPFAGHRWWGASCLDLRQKRLRFFIYDQGAGIPFTLPKGQLWERIRAFLSERGVLSDDAHTLRAAFEVGRTSTGQSNRGLGLKRMADVVRNSGSGYLRIISGRAEIIHYHDDRIETNGLTTHIGGTLIEWSMPSDIFTDTLEDGIHAND